jgi:hypothetical protein
MLPVLAVMLPVLAVMLPVLAVMLPVLVVIAVPLAVMPPSFTVSAASISPTATLISAARQAPGVIHATSVMDAAKTLEVDAHTRAVLKARRLIRFVLVIFIFHIHNNYVTGLSRERSGNIFNTTLRCVLSPKNFK